MNAQKAKIRRVQSGVEAAQGELAKSQKKQLEAAAPALDNAGDGGATQPARATRAVRPTRKQVPN